MKPFILLTFFIVYTAIGSCQTGVLGVIKPTLSTLRQRLDGTIGVLKLQENPASNFDNSAVQEPGFLQEGDSVRIYYTGLNNTTSISFKSTIGLVTAADIESTWVRRTDQVFGMGAGAPTNRRAHSSWVGKLGGTYYGFATNGYGFNYSGEDRNVYLYTSSDGLSWTDGGLAVNKTSFAGISGFGNVCIVTDKFNTPTQVNGKYMMLLEAWTGSVWEIHRAEATSITGPWTITQKLTALQITAGAMYGGASAIYSGGKIHVFYHYGSVTNTPTNIAYANSPDGITFTVKETGFLLYYDADPTPPTPPADADSPYPHTDQVADPFVGELNGKVYILAEFVQNNGGYKSQIRLWRFNGTFEQFVSGY